MPPKSGNNYTKKRRNMQVATQPTTKQGLSSVSPPTDHVKQICLQADELSKASNFHLAITLYKLALPLCVSDKDFTAKMLSHCAFAYCHIERFDSAIDFCNQAIQLNPNYAAAYNNRACTLF